MSQPSTPAQPGDALGQAQSRVTEEQEDHLLPSLLWPSAPALGIHLKKSSERKTNRLPHKHWEWPC